MQFGILGPIEARDGGRALPIPPGHQRAILALLVVNLNRVVSPERILDAIWGEDVPATGTKAIAYHVSRLRDALWPGRAHAGSSGPTGDGDARLETDPAGYVLRADPETVDAVRFERLVGHGRALLAEDAAGAREAVVEALALWRGDPLIDVAYAEFAQGAIRRLEEIRLEALEIRLEADLALGRLGDVVAECEALLREQPLRDRVRGLLMVALYRSGRQAESLRVAGEGRRLAAEELGLDPSPELQQLESWILTQDPRLDASMTRARGPADRPPRNPFKGLRAFGEADQADFYGREALVRQLVARLDDVRHGGRVLLVVGPSGCGKSSVVRAGLIPALHGGAIEGSERWPILTMVPGTSPVHELAAACRALDAALPAGVIDAAERSGDVRALLAHAFGDAARPLVLVIDQLEELYVRVDEAKRERFLAGLVGALTTPNAGLLVVGTLRADFFDRPLRSSGLGELLRQGVEIVTPLARDELERTISRPAQNVGVGIEPGLIADVIADVEDRPATLPLLEFALTELFERSDGRQLTRAGYAAIGGAPAALGRAAEAAWTSFDAEGREIAQQVLLRFVVLADGSEATGRRVPLADVRSIADQAKVDRVLDELGRRRLVTFDRDPITGEPTVEIAHEALLTHWPRLAAWVDEQRQSLWLRRRLDDATADWEASGRSPGFLATGARLEQFAAWLADARLRPTEAERTYVSASSSERARLARRGRRLRLSIGAVLAAAAVVASALTVTLVRERDSAAELQDVTTARGLASGAVASLGKDPELSVLLALQAANVTVPRGYVVEEAYDALHWALEEAHVAYPRDAAAMVVRQGPDGPRGVFLLAPDDLMRSAAAYVGRSLFPAECQAYVHDDDCRAVVAPPVGSPPLRVRTANGVVATAASLAVASTAGTRVRVLSELPASLSPLFAAFETESGITIAWEAPTAGLSATVQAGDVPDIAIVEGRAQMDRAAALGLLIDIDGLVDTAPLRADAGPYAVGLGTFDAGPGARLLGAPLAATLDDLLWYPADAFARAGYRPPATPDELTALVGRLRADGRVPWCLGTLPDGTSEPEREAGPTTMAWVEDVLLDREGTAVYDDWTAGLLPFYVDGAELPGAGGSVAQRAIESFKDIVGAPGATYGGLRNAAWTPEGQAALPMVVDVEPRCWLYHGSSTDRPVLAGRAGGAAAVPFPGATGSHPALGRLYAVVVLHDRPEVRRVVEMLLGRELADAVATELGSEGVLPVRSAAAPADPLAADEAARLRAAIEAGTFRARAIDLIPEPVARSFRETVAAYLLDVDRSLGSRMGDIDLAWELARSNARR